MKTISEEKFNENQILFESVEPENDLKNILVEYVGETLTPDNNQVTVEMIIDVMSKEFPEFLLAIAEENWVRGYQQALNDVELGEQIAEVESDSAHNVNN